MFRTILILGALALCAFMAGWFTIQRDDSETTIRINRDEIRADTSKAIAKGRELLHEEANSQPAEEAFSQQATRLIPPWEQPAVNDAFQTQQQY